MEDLNEDDEVWSNPVTDTLKISNSEQVVRGISYRCDKNLSYSQSE